MKDTHSGVLIIITGGNICLKADKDKRHQAPIHKPATIEDFELLLKGPSEEDGILIREQSIRGTRIRVDFVDIRKDTDKIYTDPETLDSSQVDPKLWQELAETIRTTYNDYEGFVILHGLDTMAYTASALSFMVGKLHVPIVFVGSQRPLNYFRTDAVQNIRSAITLAAGKSINLNHVTPEVTIFSHDLLFRGNRSTMIHASSYRAFDSPNYPPIASFGSHVEIHANLTRTPAKGKNVILRNKVDAPVSIFDVFPGMEANVIEHLADSSGLKGILLRTYGMGTAPTSSGILNALDNIIQKNIVVMNVTQARGGRISHGQDPVSLRLFEQGVISGVDMTAEAAYAKMVIFLSEGPDTADTSESAHSERERLKDLLQISYCGEQTQSVFSFHFGSGETELSPDGSFRAILKPQQMVERHLLENSISGISHAQLRVLGVSPLRDSGHTKSIDFDAYLVSKHDDLYKVNETLRQDVLRWYSTGKNTINVAYNVTPYIQNLLNPDTMLRFDTIEPISWKRLSIVFYSDASF